jgi:hypothetical protein
MNDIQRPLRPQEFIHFGLHVLTTPTPVAQSQQQANLVAAYDWMILSNPTASGRPVYYGGPGVNAGPPPNAPELPQGISISLAINNHVQHYEVQAPLVDQFCLQPVVIPFYVWDVANFFLVATAATDISVMLFKAGFR